MRFKSLPKPAVCLTLRRRLARPAECAPFVKRLSMNYEETTSHRALSTTRVQAAWWFLIIGVAFRKYPARRGAARGKLGIHLCKSGNFRKWTFDVLCVSRATTELGWRIFCSLSIKRLFAGTDVNPAVRNRSCTGYSRRPPFDEAKVLIEWLSCYNCGLNVARTWVRSNCRHQIRN